jgi:Flp pilus assembly CpaE family ATPase
MARPAVICALPRDEAGPVAQALAAAGLDVIKAQRPEEVEATLRARHDVGLAIVDGEFDFDTTLEIYALLHESGRRIPCLMVVSARTLERLDHGPQTGTNDEFLTRPYSAESLRWRVEAMLIRAETYDDGSGDILKTGPIAVSEWGKRATVVALFNPKGGVGKTTIAINVATVLQTRNEQRVLLIDADTVTGHIATSLGLDRYQTVADAWEDAGSDGADANDSEAQSGLAALATAHPNGLRVTILTNTPKQAHRIDPVRFADSLSSARVGFDVVVVDLHPDYGELTQAIFDRCDRILVPVTPDLPAIRAALQFLELAGELGVKDRVNLVVNRANSGVSVADIEKAIGLKAFGQIRSGGLLFVRAANEGATVVELFPKEKVTGDFEALADKVLTRDLATTDKGLFRMLPKPREAVKA